MKILLISANQLTSPYPVYPLGLDYVAGAISAKHSVRIADMNALGDFSALGKMIEDFSPDMIGISLRNADNTDADDPKGFMGQYQDLSTYIRSISNIPIVLGGSGFTIFPAEMMKALQADYGLIGEGERLLLLLDALEKKDDLSQIPGLVCREKSVQIPKPLDRAFSLPNLPDMPHTAYYLKNGGMLNLQSKRGCSYNCIYCTYPHIEGRKLRLVAPEKVAEAALRLQNAGAKYFFVTDAVFNSHYEHSAEVARAFRKSGISIPWGAFFLPGLPPDDYYQCLADAGLRHAEFGTESLSGKMLAAYGKPFRAAHVFAAHKAAIRAGIHAAHYFLPGGPGENQDTLRETLTEMEKLEKTVLFFFCGMRIYPHTRLYEIARNEGQIRENQNLLEPVYYHSPHIRTEEILRQVREKAKNRSNWIIGAGGEETAAILRRMYAKGYTGPLWEYLIR
ncbi:MAG: lipid biosynthesis B12-binding/radical SAM protein [Desulfobacterales bacterium]